MISLPCRFDLSDEDDIFEEEDRSLHVESLKRLVNKGFARAKELSKEVYAECYEASAICPPIGYGVRPDKAHQVVESAYNAISKMIKRSPTSMLLLFPALFSDLVIVDNYYHRQKEPIFGRQYTVYKRKEPRNQVESTTTILGDLYSLLGPLERIEDKITEATHIHSTQPIDSQKVAGFTNNELPERVLPISADEFAHLGVCEMLVVDSALLGGLETLSDLSKKDFGQNYEVYLHGKHR